MGNVMQAVCGCGYKEDFYLGSGMLYFNPDIVKTLFDTETADKIDIWLKTHELKEINARNSLARCDYCGHLAAVPTAVFTAADGTYAEFDRSCECTGHYTEIEESVYTSLPCPSCKKELALADVGWWD